MYSWRRGSSMMSPLHWGLVSLLRISFLFISCLFMVYKYEVENI